MLRIFTSLTVVFWLTFILSQAAHADKASPQCEAFVSDRALLPTEIQAALTENGYFVKKIDMADMKDNADFAKLLRSSGDIVLKVMPNHQMAFYMAAQVPASSANWRPLKNLVSYKEFLAQPSKYSCKNIQRNLHLINLTRSAVAQGLRCVFPKPPTKAAKLNWGHFFLTLEYNLAVRSGRPFDITAADKKYDRLLRRIEGLKLNTGLNFFSRWREVKEILYSSNQENLDYCRDKTFLADALLAHCTNCIGYTTLLSALTKDAGITGPAGWQLGIESYSDHIRPVLFNSKEQQTFDLSTGMFGSVNAPIYQMNDLVLLALRNQNFTLFPEERRLLQKASLHSLYQPWFAHPQPSTGAKKQSSIYDFSALASAGRFSPQDPPARADYSHLAEFATMEESPHGLSRLWSGVSSMWTGLFGRRDKRLVPAQFNSYQEKMLSLVLPDLAPSEKKVVAEALREHRVTSDFIRAFQYKKVFEILKIDTDSWHNIYPQGPFAERRGLALPFEVPAVARTPAALDSVCTSLSIQPDKTWLFKTTAQQERYRGMTTPQRYADLIRLLQTDIDRLGGRLNATQTRWSLDELLDESANNIVNAHRCVHSVFVEMRSISDFLGRRLGLVDDPTDNGGEYFPLEFVLAKEPAHVVLDDIGTLFENLTTQRHRFLKEWNGKAPEKRRSLSVTLTELAKDYRDYKVFLEDRQKKDDPANKLIMSVLLDPDFFYTTAPDQSELKAEQWKPLRQISAREKRRLEQKARRLLSPVAAIHPPVFDGFHCQPGQDYAGGQGQGLQVIVECKTGDGEMGASSQTMDGDPNGREGANGSDDFDRQGTKLQTGRDDTDPGYEYRQEIDLHPDVLHSLLSSASWYFDANPLARLMIHYLWRKSLPTTADDYYSHLNFPPADFENAGLRISLPVFMAKILTPCHLDQYFSFDSPDNQCLLQQFRGLIAQHPVPRNPTVPAYIQDGLPFVRLALTELTEHPKKIAVILPEKPITDNKAIYYSIGDIYKVLPKGTQFVDQTVHRGIGIIHPEITLSISSSQGIQPITSNMAEELQNHDAYDLWNFLRLPF